MVLPLLLLLLLVVAAAPVVDWVVNGSPAGSGPTIMVSNSGTVEVNVTDASGCPGSTSVNISANPPVVPTINGNLVICPGQSTMLQAGGGAFVSFEWTLNGAVISSAPNVSVSLPGTVALTVTDAAGCTGSTNVNVTTALPLLPNINGITAICPGQSTSLSASGGAFTSFSWAINGTPIGAGPVVTVNQPGLLELTVMDGNGCP